MRTAMTMDRIEHYRGKPVLTSDGDKIGSVEHVYFNVDTNEPEWLAVGAGILSNRFSMVPLRGATFEDDRIVVPFTKEQVKNSPDVAPDAISRHMEQQLYSYYGQQGQWGQPSSDPYSQPAQPVTDPTFGDARFRRWHWEYGTR